MASPLTVPVMTTELPLKAGDSSNSYWRNLGAQRARFVDATIDSLAVTTAVLDTVSANTLEVFDSFSMTSGPFSVNTTGAVSIVSSDPSATAISLVANGLGGGIAFTSQAGGITFNALAGGSVQYNVSGGSSFSTTSGGWTICTSDATTNGQVKICAAGARNDAVSILANGSSGSDGILLSATNSGQLGQFVTQSLIASGTYSVTASGTSSSVTLAAVGSINSSMTLTSAGSVALNGATGVTIGTASAAAAAPVLIQTSYAALGSTITITSAATGASAIALNALAPAASIVMAAGSSGTSASLTLNGPSTGQATLSSSGAASITSMGTATIQSTQTFTASSTASDMILTAVSNNGSIVPRPIGSIVLRYAAGLVTQSYPVLYTLTASTTNANIQPSDIQGGMIRIKDNASASTAYTVTFPTANSLASVILGGGSNVLVGDTLTFVLAYQTTNSSTLAFTANTGVTIDSYASVSPSINKNENVTVKCVFTAASPSLAYTVYA